MENGNERASGLLVKLTDFLDVVKVQVRIRDGLAAAFVQGQLLKMAHLTVSSDGEVYIECSNTFGAGENYTTHLIRPP